MLHRLGRCEGDRDRRERVGKGRDGRGWPVMAAGAGAGMTTGVGGATKVTARRAGTPVTPVTPLQKLHWQLMCQPRYTCIYTNDATNSKLHILTHQQ